MSILKQSAIKEIASEIAKGNTCYIHRNTSKITSIDNSIEEEEQIAAQAITVAELERKIENYVKVAKLTKEELMVIMKDFLEELSSKSERKQLSNALNRNNPIRNFYQAIESDMVLNQHWGNYVVKEYQRWVSNVIIDAYNY